MFCFNSLLVGNWEGIYSFIQERILTEVSGTSCFIAFLNILRETSAYAQMFSWAGNLKGFIKLKGNIIVDIIKNSD